MDGPPGERADDVLGPQLMPPFEHMDRHQRVLLWPKYDVNRHGQVRVRAGDRVEILTRWVRKRKDVLLPDQSVVTVDVTMTTNRVIPIGSICWEGGLVDLDDNGATGTGTGTAPGEEPDSDLMQVITHDRATDLKGRIVRHDYGLIKWGDALPLI